MAINKTQLGVGQKMNDIQIIKEKIDRLERAWLSLREDVEIVKELALVISRKQDTLEYKFSQLAHNQRQHQNDPEAHKP